MREELWLFLFTWVFTNLATWLIATHRATSRMATLRQDFDLHKRALELTDKRLRMVLRLTIDIAKKMNLEIRAADILEMADVLGDE